MRKDRTVDDKGKPKEPWWQLWTDSKGLKWGRIVNPGYWPKLPYDAKEAHLAIPPDEQDRNSEHKCSINEKRAAFRTGWKQSGASEHLCDQMFAKIEGTKPSSPKNDDWIPDEL